jgi:small-conductance mechanosensitive channel
VTPEVIARDHHRAPAPSTTPIAVCGVAEQRILPGVPGSALADLVTSETVGIAVALALVAIVRLFLPSSTRALLRTPIALLVLHLLARALLLVLTPGELAARITTLTAVVLLFASIGRSGFLLAIDVIVDPRLARPLPRIFRDIIQGVVYVVLLLVALRSVGVEPGSILTTSALLTAAIALSLQETLGNLVAGLAIQAQRPFDVDDWIQFDADPKHIGRVLEINWRATKVLTLDDVEVVVPNATLAKAPITNFTKPTAASRRSLYIQVPPDTPPHVVRAAILGALPGAFGVVEKPPPSVVLNAFVDGNNEYWVRFHTDRFHERDGVDSAARERIWYAFARAGIPPAPPGRAVKLEEISHDTREREAKVQAERRAGALAAVDFLTVLSPDQRQNLADASRIHVFGAGETVVKQGDASAEMFIVHSGSVVVVRERSNGGPPGAIEVARLGPGEFFGEMALMTGEPRTATVRTTSPSTLIGVDHEALKAVLESAPELADRISRSIAERQEAMSSRTAIVDDAGANVEERSSLILGRIKRFFALR